jgi:hypothetical protein
MTKYYKSARAGIRTRVKGVTVPHTGPDFTMQQNAFLYYPGTSNFIITKTN